MKEAFPAVVIIAITTAFFSGVCEHTVLAHPRTSELTPYVPSVNTTMAK